MKIIPFPEHLWTGGPYPENPNAPDDFQQEIELTRRNESLMTMLESRGQCGATVSLEEVKLRLAHGWAAMLEAECPLPMNSRRKLKMNGDAMSNEQ